MLVTLLSGRNNKKAKSCFEMDLLRIRADFHQLCRFCLSKEQCIRIFTGELELNERLAKLLDILLAKIDGDDGFPNSICMKCVACVEQFVEFEATCERSYELLGKALNLPIDDGCANETKSEPESFQNDELQEDVDDGEEYLIDKPTVDDGDDNCAEDELVTIERLEDEQISIIDEQVVLQEEEIDDIPEEDRENPHESFNLTNEQQSMMDAAMEVQPSGFIDRGSRKVPLVECLYCRNMYRGRNTLKKHLRIHLNIKDNQCAFCPRTFTDRSSLLIHQARHTGKSFKCTQCRKSYFSQNELRQHVTMQHMERRYTCETCQRKFPSKTILNDHYRVHLPERPFVCKQCGAGFKRNRNLVRHQFVHQKADEKLKASLKCLLCSDPFDLPIALLKHLKTEHVDQLDSIRTGSFECAQCDGSQFEDLLDSLTHQQTHYTSTAERKDNCYSVSCGECGKHFKSRPAAMTHMLTHDGSSCFSCFECEASKRRILFKDLAHLEAHRKEAHGKRAP